MRTLTESRFLRLLNLGALYFAQGVPWGFIAVGYVVFLTDRGLDNAAIGDAIGLAYVPWSFKILGGPIIDRFPSRRFGRRRHFIVAAQLLMGLTLLALLTVDVKTQLGLMGALLFAHNTCAALQDVATDALAVDVLPADERGKANSVMWAAKSAGVALGGGGGTVLAKHLGWSSLFVLNAIVIWLVMLLVLAVRERPASGAAEAAKPTRLDWGELKRSFGFATPLLGIAVAMLTPAGYSLVSSVTTRLFRADLGLSEERIALLSGTIDPITGILGALAGGVLADRIGVRKTMGLFMGITGLGLMTFGLAKSLWPSFAFLVAWSVVGTFSIYAYNAATLGFFMTLSNPAIGATQFATFMAATNLTYSWTHPVGGRLADGLGVQTTFLIASAVQLLSILLLPLVDPKLAEHRFRASRGEKVVAA